MAKVYEAWNGAQPTTAALPKITTGTAIKTLLQIATPATEDIEIVAWGVMFDGSTAAVPIDCELIDTDVAATVTAHVAAGLSKWSDPQMPASLMTLGVAASGYTATAEGAPGATSRLLDNALVPPSQSYVYEWPLGRGPRVAVSRFLRVRVTAAVAVNAKCFVRWEE
jgi:hypothetical protein